MLNFYIYLTQILTFFVKFKIFIASCISSFLIFLLLIYIYSKITSKKRFIIFLPLILILIFIFFLTFFYNLLFLICTFFPDLIFEELNISNPASVIFFGYQVFGGSIYNAMKVVYTSSGDFCSLCQINIRAYFDSQFLIFSFLPLHNCLNVINSFSFIGLEPVKVVGNFRNFFTQYHHHSGSCYVIYRTSIQPVFLNFQYWAAILKDFHLVHGNFTSEELFFLQDIYEITVSEWLYCKQHFFNGLTLYEFIIFKMLIFYIFYKLKIF